MMIEYLKIAYSGCDVDAATFRPSEGQAEWHLMFHPSAEDSFEKQYACIKNALDAFIADKAGAVPVFMRWFLSDSANQQKTVEADDYSCAVSIIEQPPLDGTKVGLWVWLAEGATAKYADGIWETEFAGARHLWTAKECRSEGDSEKQTGDMFKDYSAMLEGRGCTLKDNCLRTWLFVQNIDVNYKGVVKGRREFFSGKGLTADTHYIASTGIAGRVADAEASVIMDTYAVEGISENQIRFLKGSTHLNPTHEYGVTFERGTAVNHSDRRHVFISGTASIDNKGEIVHTGDISGQTLRMIENVGVLLNEAGCDFENIAQIIVYLRDISDYRKVAGIINERFPSHPKTFLWAPVCRPGWLVEMECIAVKVQ